MIFLTVGTWRVGYDRLVKAVDELVGSHVITEEVFAQTGYSSYKPKHMQIMDFCSPNEFVEIVSKSRVVISHAGMGTIIEAVKQAKPVVVVPRKTELGEVDDDHQYATARQLEKEGKILVAYEANELPAKLKEAESFVPVRDQSAKEIVRAVQEFIDGVVAKKMIRQTENGSRLISKFWPYKILRRDDDDIKADLSNIMEHFAAEGQVFDIVVFVPYAGKYLSELFAQVYTGSCQVNFVTVRRVSTVIQENPLKKFIFRRKWLSDIFRHVDVLWRLIKYTLGSGQKMVAETAVEFDVKGKKMLVIDDDIATGTTLAIVKSTLLEHGALSVTTASISNHFLPNKIEVDYSVYKYKLLRTKNSRDYNAA